MKSRSKSFFVICGLMFLSGCGAVNVEMASMDEDRKAKLFTNKTNQSVIYLYRNERFGAAIPMPIMINEKLIGRTAPYVYFRFETEPGEYDVKSFAEDITNLVLNTKPGEIHYIKQEVKMGTWIAKSILYEVDEATGRNGVLECELAQPLVTTFEKKSKCTNDDGVEKLKLQLEVEKLKYELERLKLNCDKKL